MDGAFTKFVKTANSFLFFFGFILLLSIATYQVYDINFREDRRPHNSIQIVDSDSTADKPIKYKKSFVKKMEDIYIFRISSNRLLSSNSNSGTKVEYFNMFSGSNDYDDFETVNFMFASTDNKPRLLLESNALILNYELMNFEPLAASYGRQFKTSKHLFTVVLNDDNQDNVLDKKDKIKLVASNYNGTDIITIADDINGYEIVDDNLLLLTQIKEGETINRIYKLGIGTSQTLIVN